MTITKEHVKIGPLLERQGRLLEIRNRLSREWNKAPHARPAHLEQGPWITISKAMGSGWEEVARRVAHHLGWQMFDREILEEIARESHVREGILSLLDEREVTWIDETLARLANPDRPGHHAFLDQMARVILALGRRGHTILVGRGANWLLEPACGLRVRMVAPLQVRIARYASDHELTQVEARERIQDDDAARARFIRQVYRQEIDDPSGYDMILNVGALEAEAASDCILAALRRKLPHAANTAR